MKDKNHYHKAYFYLDFLKFKYLKPYGSHWDWTVLKRGQRIWMLMCISLPKSNVTNVVKFHLCKITRKK